MANSLKAIKAPIATELKNFEKKFKKDLQGNVAMLDKIMGFIVKRKGKQMRPMFVFLCSKLAGEVQPASYHAASMIELLHTATLIHDDVVDESYERRGFFSLNALWKNKISVLVGDYIFSRGFLLALEHKLYKLLEIMSNAVKEMSEGELLQIEKARRLDIKEDVYYEIIRQKTASLIAAACAVGAASVTQEEEIVEKVKLMGEKIGMAFQIRDDLFDFGDADVGKPLGIDIKEKKMTLPLIYALNEASKKEKRYIINIVRNHNTKPEKVREVILFVRKSGGLEYATEVMYQYREEAFKILREFPESPSRQALEDLVIFVTERKK